jgi:hypothetical protein
MAVNEYDAIIIGGGHLVFLSGVPGYSQVLKETRHVYTK